MINVKGTLAVLTGGGDCPGLNAVLNAVVKAALGHGYQIYGIENGFNGLIRNRMKLLTYDDVSGILPRGGTVLGTTNRDNPFKFAHIEKDGSVTYTDESETIVKNLAKRGIETLIVIGGDGSLAIGAQLSRECGVKVIGVPKTIDNDLPCTERTFGFDTAMAVATEAVDRLHTTAESHHRIMILEVMGRYAGWIALHSGIAGGADVILIPEIPYHLKAVAAKVLKRQQDGKMFSIIVVAEGAKPVGGEMTVARIVKDSFEPIRLGGVGNKLAQELEELTGIESRCTILGYLQRGGSPTAFDRVLCTRYGVAAIEACMAGDYDVMVSLHNDSIVTVPLQDAGGKPRSVAADNEIVKAARAIGICFGDEE
ncbi:MAG: 6-phosphofructokinase [Acidaminococcaceae bacterium]|nr:6-phosphofructokinase [Acidaminococcaceae bacterium]